MSAPRSFARHLAVPLAVVSLFATYACIERPPGSMGGRAVAAPTGDRSMAHDALVQGVPTPHHPVGAVFDGIELVGYDMTPDPAPRGGVARMTVYYKALEDITEDWQVFVHLEDEARVEQRFNMDHSPTNGRLHANAWRKGDIIRDEWSFTFPMSTKTLEFWTGFFIEDNRMPLTSPGRGASDGSGRVKAGLLSSQ